MRCDIRGKRGDAPVHYISTFAHNSAAVATGLGTGSVAEFMLSGKLHKPGVYPVEQALPTDLFEAAMDTRHLKIHVESNSARAYAR